uniref:porin family protein n=1 Tax=Ornithobacterium rhinotracheale TaxID=28251 RepID=UPI0039A5B3CC
MKKLLYVALMSLGVTSAIAQQADRKVEYGLKVGYTNSNARWDLPKVAEYGPSTSGYLFGVFAEIPLYTNLTLQPELNYNKTGYKSDGINEQKGGWAKTTRENLSLPLMLKYYFYNGLNVQLGPQFDYFIDSKLNEQWLVNREMTAREVNYNYVMSKFNVGAVVGLGYKLPMGLSFDARYNYGLTNFMKPKEALKAEEPTDTFKSDVFSFSVGYQF